MIKLELGLVIRLLADASGLDKTLHALHLYKQVGINELGGVILLLIHSNERIAFTHTRSYFSINMFDFTRERGRNIHRLIALKIGREGDFALDFA